MSSVTSTASLSSLERTTVAVAPPSKFTVNRCGVAGLRTCSVWLLGPSSFTCCQTTPPVPIATTAAAATRNGTDATTPTGLVRGDGSGSEPATGGSGRTVADAGEHPVAQLVRTAA